MSYDWDDRDRDRYGREGRARGYGHEGYRGRDWSDRAGDEMRSWFGDDEAERRRRMDEARGGRDYGGRDYGGYGGREHGYGREGYGGGYGREDDDRGGYRGRGGYGRSDRDFGEDYGRGGYGQSGRYGRRWSDDDRAYGGGYGREDYRRREEDYRGEDRGFLERAGDEIASWFGDEEAERRRRMDERRAGEHRGRGPKGYTRSDERIREDVSDRLSDDPHIDASDIEVSVSGGEVTLSGTVRSRFDKRHAEDLAERISGVRHVQNNLRVSEGGTLASLGNVTSGTATGVFNSDRLPTTGGAASGSSGSTAGTAEGATGRRRGGGT